MAGRLPYGRQWLDESDISEVVECLRGDWLTQGPRVTAFEQALCEATGARYAVAVCNGTAALHLAALVLGVREGDVGVCPAVSFLSSAHCIRYCGGEVEFTDVEADTGLLSIDALSSTVDRLVTEGRAPKVLVPVDLTGQPADWARVRAIADRCGARVLLDAAHSIGAEYHGAEGFARLGKSGADAAILSFHPVKHVTTAEGGAIVTNDESIFRELASLRTFGMHKDASRFSREATDPMVGPWYYETEVLGYNYRLSDLQCALGLSQIRKLGAFIERRRAIAARYDAALRQAPFSSHLSPIRQHEGRRSAYHLYVAQVRGSENLSELAASRKDLFLHLGRDDIHCQVHYVPLPWQPYYRRRHQGEAVEYVGAARYYASSLSLPMFPAMTDADVDRVIGSLRTWVERRG